MKQLLYPRNQTTRMESVCVKLVCFTRLPYGVHCGRLYLAHTLFSLDHDIGICWCQLSPGCENGWTTTIITTPQGRDSSCSFTVTVITFTAVHAVIRVPMSARPAERPTANSYPPHARAHGSSYLPQSSRLIAARYPTWLGIPSLSVEERFHNEYALSCCALEGDCS